MEIFTTVGKWQHRRLIAVKLDEEDFPLVNQYKISISAGYIVLMGIGLPYHRMYLHRVLTQAPDGMLVDHINTHKHDNTRANLRVCSKSQNMMNLASTNRPVSGYFGVRRHQTKWLAQFRGAGGYIGVYDTAEEAAFAYDSAVKSSSSAAYARINFTSDADKSKACLKIAMHRTQKSKETLAPEEVFGLNIPVNGSSYTAPHPESTANILRDYTTYLPGLLQATAGQQTNVANAQLAATQATQPGYNALNLQQAQQTALPLAQVGQQVANSNALAGAQTNVNQLLGPGGQAAQAALGVARSSNPNYYKIQDASSNQAANLVNSIQLGGLSPGEANATERATNQGMQGTGNLGLRNNTNTLSNALNFGGAFNQKLGVLGNALGAANQTATSAQNTGFNPINVALGQPNASTMGNFGTGTFSPTNAGTQNASAGNAFNFGSSMLGNQVSANNPMVAGSYGMQQSTTPAAYMQAVGSLMPSCCFIMLEAYHGEMPWWVRKCRDRYYRKLPQVAKGYVRMAKWLVPLMRGSGIVRQLVWTTMVSPLTDYGSFVVRRTATRHHKWSRQLWFTVWNYLGK